MIFAKHFDFPKGKEKEKNFSREKTSSTSFSFSRKRKKEMKSGDRKPSPFGTIFETIVPNIRVYQAKTFDLFLLSATWTERVITLNSNFHVPFALHGLSERRGGRAGRYTLAKIRILFPLCVYFLRKTIRENFTAIAFTIVSRSHCSSTSNRIELTG